MDCKVQVTSVGGKYVRGWATVTGRSNHNSSRSKWMLLGNVAGLLSTPDHAAARLPGPVDSLHIWPITTSLSNCGMHSVDGLQAAVESEAEMIGCCDSTATTAVAPQETGPSGERVADVNAISEGGRLHLQVQGRYISILKLEGKLHCIDSICFHAGGPLGVGDIEELNGRSCIICPWHYYKIDIETGDKYYQQMSFVNGKMEPGEWASNGIKQRTHKVTEWNGGIYVELSKTPMKRDSDQYAFSDACGQRIMAVPGGVQGANVGADGRKPSGQVLANARRAERPFIPFIPK